MLRKKHWKIKRKQMILKPKNKLKKKRPKNWKNKGKLRN